jgi:hypothetical protein
MKLLAFLFAASILAAQPSTPPSVIYVTSDPAGACAASVQLRFNTSNGKLWGCNALTWSQIGGGGGGTLSGITGLPPTGSFISSQTGVILAASSDNNGSGYAVGDTGLILGAGYGAIYTVSTVTAGAVSTFTLSFAGIGYTTGDGQATAPLTGGGDGNFTVNITQVSTARLYGDVGLSYRPQGYPDPTRPTVTATCVSSCTTPYTYALVEFFWIGLD